MNPKTERNSILLRYYQQYLSDADTARFISQVANRYSLATLERLLTCGDVNARRAAALAIGLLGDAGCINALGPLLCSSDRKLRLVVDDAIRAIGSRCGTAAHRQQLEKIIRANECGDFERVVEMSSELMNSSGRIAECYHQRSLAFFHLDSIELAIDDCRQALKINSYHYAAMVGLGHCHLELGDLLEALFWFRRALEVYPDLEPVRAQVRRLEKAIQEL